MINKVYAQGSWKQFTHGSIRFQDVATVLTPSAEQIRLGTRRVQPRYAQVHAFNGGRVASIYDLSPVTLPNLWGSMSLGLAGQVRWIRTDPFGAFEDFALFPYNAADPRTSDPVNGLVVTDNAGQISGGVGQDWTHHKRIFLPPKKTRYVVPKIGLGSVAAGKSQHLDAFQIETLPKDATDVSGFQSPRSLGIVVRPDRINLSENPSGQVNSEAWFGVRVSPSGGLEADGGPAYHYVRDITPGEWYTKSVYVDAGQSVTLDGQTQFIEHSGRVRRLWVAFKATEEWCSLDLDSTGPYRAFKAMVEPGTFPRPYFDGDTTSTSSLTYLWEYGKPAGAGRSYMYVDKDRRHYILQQTIQENVPIGVSVLEPIYGLGAEVTRSYGFGLGAYGLTTYGE